MKSNPKLKIIILLLLFNLGLYSQTKSFELLEHKFSSCDQQSDPVRLISRLSDFKISNDTLDFSIDFVGNCCLQEKPELTYSKDTLTIQYKDLDCYCNCCFSSSFKIKGSFRNDLIIKLGNNVIRLSDEKFRKTPVEYKIIKGKKVNYIDELGLKQGIWIDNETTYFLYKDNKMYAYGKFYQNYRIKTEYNSENKTFTEYTKKGKIRNQNLIK